MTDWQTGFSFSVLSTHYLSIDPEAATLYTYFSLSLLRFTLSETNPCPLMWKKGVASWHQIYLKHH
jgi:hypothetical protein